tara:strand:- start:1508 stop:2632 length:1125 start_codon:yes stop_codon:yes gene_type:complete
MPPSMQQRKRIREKQGRSERGNVFEDTGIGRALADVLSQPSDYEKQSFGERRSGRPRTLTEEAKKEAAEKLDQEQKAAKRRNEITARGQTKGQAKSDQDRSDFRRKQARLANMAGKRRATGERKPFAGEDYWTTIFGQMEDMGAMPDDKTPTEEVLAPENSSETIQTVIKDEAPIEDDSDTSAESKAYWNELFDRYEAMESQPDEVKEVVEKIIADDPELIDQDMTVDEEEFAEFMENRPEFMIPAGNPLADFDVYIDDEGKTRVRESMEKIASSKPTPQMEAGSPTFSSFMANLFDPVSKQIEDLYTKFRLAGTSAEKYEVMDAIEDLQNKQSLDRARTQIQPRRVDKEQKQYRGIPAKMRRAIQASYAAGRK